MLSNQSVPESVRTLYQAIERQAMRRHEVESAAKPFLFFTTTFPGLEVSEATWADWDEAYGLFHDIESANESTYA
jgi:hypothetical protein